MPPKQVYGRRTTTKPTAAFSKFITPDKDAVFVDGGRKNVAKPKQATADEIDAIGDVLAKMGFDDDKENAQVNEEEGEVVQVVKKKGRPRKTGRKSVEKEPEINDLIENLTAITIYEEKEATQQDRPQGKKNRPRKSPKPSKDVAVPKGGTHGAPQEQTREPQKHAGKQSTVSPPRTPVRGRKLKAVLIPKRSSSPAMASSPTPELTPDVTPEPEDVYTTYVSSLLSQSYGKRIVSFEKWSSDLVPHFTVSKIAEASFSEVYRLSATSATSGSSDESVLKLVALKTPPNAPLPSQSQGRRARDPKRQAKLDMQAREEKDLWKSHVDDVYSEVKLLQNLNDIPGFTNFREVTVLQGKPSTMFANAWKSWNKTRPKGKKSEFPDPNKKTSYEDTQLWAVVEMQDAGTDCEKVMEAGGVGTVWEVWDVFWGVCLSVAKAEGTCKFEHRDLHLENICIRSSRSPSKDDLTRPFIRDPLKRKLGFTGLDTTVIDYTLSRAEVTACGPTTSHNSPLNLKSNTSVSGSPTEPEVAYLDLNKDTGIFSGDASEEYQYEIYRYMRGVVLYQDPLRNSPPKPNILAVPDTFDTPRRSPRKTAQLTRFDDDGIPETMTPRRSPRKCMTGRSWDPPSDIWKSFHPKTNLIWAHFILFKLLEHLKGSEPTALTPKQVMRNVEAKPDETAKVVKRATRLHKILRKVAEMLEPGELGKKESLGSVQELVVLAIEERWLRVEDVAGS
ncbi:hypothetical protein P280DRAFT_464554 [Massarina eburnea CBS 473.64]|uniref:non-specific serine/threonine protein kinase n=1 Tax=Massarina eburnea CBS 473.64 TaxID=1395130 RepID=A0A6A6SIS9_9PLEO|nr:hypothetical protein P280DRAFT_464554 [Massarina eburnea CBS 473.64]